ncbi:MAG: ABC transporter ATP-binding protein [Pseudomonadota bacterium]
MSRMPHIGAEGRWRRIAEIAACALGQAVAAGWAAFATRDVFAAIRNEDPSAATGSIAAIACSGVIIAALRVRERVVSERVGQGYAAVLREKLFNHVAAMPTTAVASYRSGALALRFVGDLSSVRGWVGLGVGRLISAAITLPAAAIVLISLNPALGAAAIVPIAIGVTAVCVIGFLLAPAHRRLRSRRSRLAADMSERIACAPELRLMGRMEIERRNMKRRTERLTQAALTRAQGGGLLDAIPDAAAGAAAASLFTSAILTGATAADVAGEMAALSILTHPMRRLAGVWDRHRAYAAARAKCERLLGAPKLKRHRRPRADKARRVLGPTAPARLSFNAVTARAIRNVTVEAAPGERIAVIGANGAGKSTLLTLAAGLELPMKGRVRIDGVAPTSLTAAERRRAIAYVGGRSPILAGSLRRALTMGCAERPDDADIFKTAATYGFAAVIERLGGLDGQVSEAGRNLSAGEARRLMLTRAALIRPKLLLLDEPDDVLDPQGVGLLTRLYDETQATALVATHNIRTARAADAIWLVADGAVAATGRPEDLDARTGPIAEFFSLRPAA